MSLAETQQIMQVLQEIMQILDHVDVKATKMQRTLPQTKEALNTFNQLERVALRYLAITRHMGLSDNAQAQIQILTRILVTVRMLQMSFRLLSMATPYGFVMGLAGFAMSGFSIYQSMEGY